MTNHVCVQVSKCSSKAEANLSRQLQHDPAAVASLGAGTCYESKHTGVYLVWLRKKP